MSRIVHTIIIICLFQEKFSREQNELKAKHESELQKAKTLEDELHKEVTFNITLQLGGCVDFTLTFDLLIVFRCQLARTGIYPHNPCLVPDEIFILHFIRQQSDLKTAFWSKKTTNVAILQCFSFNSTSKAADGRFIEKQK